MKIQRFLAKDMRTALGQVRDTLGPDAVILSSGRVGSDVEVVAAMDFEAVQHEAQLAAARATPSTFERLTAKPAAPAAVAPPARRASSQISPEIAAVAKPDTEAQGALAEMKDLRRMLESQLATLAWNDLTRRSPIQAAMLKEMAQLGITQDLANRLVTKIPATLNFSAA